MGHDIIGLCPEDNETEVAYLRRSAFNERNHDIYKALNCYEMSGGVSGIGESKSFTKEELEKGLESLDHNISGQEVKFLKDCIKAIGDHKTLEIGFF